MKLAALVPMRHHSQRVPGKNYRPLAGKPLFHHIIETLLAVPEIETVMVDTDSEPVMDSLRRFFPNVKLIQRPEHLRADDVPMNAILLHDTAQVDADFYLQTHSTNPLLKAETISRGIQAFFSSYPAKDSLFSVTRLQTRLYDQLGKALNHNPLELIQTQNLPPIYEENSCLYLFTRENLARKNHRIGDNPFMFEIDRDEAWDIDEELDFEVTEFLMKENPFKRIGLQQMKKFLSTLFNAPWYPIVISAYPLLALLSANEGQVQINVGVRPLLVSIIFGGLLFFIIWFFLRQVHKAAFLTTLLLALFFTYGHAYIYIDETYPDSNYTLWLAIGWIVLLALALFWATRPKLTFVSSASTLNTVALALLIMSVGQINFERETGSVHALALENAPVESDLVRPENPPDVYFFLLDSYARADLLSKAYGFDNSEFINELEDRDFFVAQCSQSNYVRTEISLGSSLNLQYLQELSDVFAPDSTARRLLWDSLKHNAVRYNFENMGYETVSFATGFAWLDVNDTDHFFSPPPASSGMTEFEGLFLRTTAARYAQDLGWVDPDYLLGVGFRDRFNNIFDNIDNIAKIGQPTYSYIHVISPHPPFVFDPEGNPTYPPDFWNERRQYPAGLYQKGYLNQLQFLNKKMLQAIDTIVANSETPPIIILQGDHGPWLQPQDKRFWNLTAIYFPDHKDELYQTISPVNIFRLVFNTYFGGKYDILEDVSYFSPVPNLYEFTEMPYPCDVPNN